MNRLRDGMLILLLVCVTTSSVLQIVNQVQRNKEIQTTKKLNQDFAELNELKAKLNEQQMTELEKLKSLVKQYSTIIPDLLQLSEQATNHEQ